MKISMSPKEVANGLAKLVLVLFIANLISIVMKLYVPGIGASIMSYFNFDKEQNIPTFYSAMALVFCFVLLFLISLEHRKSGNKYVLWMFLSFIFLFLGIDEISSLHEIMGKKVRAFLNTSGVFFFAWIIPYGIGIIVLLLGYIRFLKRLPRNIRNLFLLSGVIFVGGALGMEMVGGWHSERYGEENLPYSLIYTLEESLEMIGVIIFIYALISYIEQEFNTFEISIKK